MTVWRGEEKYACEACIKGHRVSSCTHVDRDLQHVAKKGRPVSQCPHCRTLRKNRASHIKCVCAEYGMTKEGLLTTPPNGCECATGQQCVCGAKNFPLDTNSIPKVAMHKRAHSYNIARPVISARRSQSDLVSNPNLMPTTTRVNNSAKQFHPYMRHGQSHSMSSFQTSPQDFAVGYDTQPSTPGSAFSATPPQGHRSVRSEQSSPANDPLNTFLSPNHLPVFENSQLQAYSSPHNQARYSMNDFSQFQHEQPASDNTAVADFQPQSQQMVWPYSDGQISFPVPVPMSVTSSAHATAGQRESICSMDQPGLTHSPSASTDTAESITSEQLTSWSIAAAQGYASGAQVKPDPDWTMFNGGIEFSNANLCYRPAPAVQGATDTVDYFMSQHHGYMPDESDFLTPTGNAAGPGPAMAVTDHSEWRGPAPNFQLPQLDTDFDRPGQAPKPIEYGPFMAPQQTYVDNAPQYAPYYHQGQ